MSKKDKDSFEKQKQQKVFEDVFASLLRKKDPFDSIVNPDDPNQLDQDLFGPPEEQQPVSLEDLEDALSSYIPNSIHDKEWESFVSRPPIPPLTKEQEQRAVSIGLQEITKIKEYMLYIHRHMTNEFKSIYAVYTLLLEKDLQEILDLSHKSFFSILDDMEHLIAGDIDNIEEAKKDFRLHQIFQEKRLSILYGILDHYNKK